MMAVQGKLCFLTLSILILIATQFIVLPYAISYVAICITLIVGIKSADKAASYIFFFILIYLSFGLLNISSYRGYTSAFVCQLYLLTCLALVVPFVAVKIRESQLAMMKHHDINLIFKVAVFFHICIAYMALMYIFASNGNIFINQGLRFNIPTSIEYIIKSILVLPLFPPMLKMKKTTTFFFIFICVLPAIAIGSRGTSIMSLFGYFLSLLFFYRQGLNSSLKIKFHKKILLVLSGIFIIFTGFYARRSGDGVLISVDMLVSLYFDYSNILIYLILPLYMGFNETIGITNRIISDGVFNNVSSIPLFFADLVTVLPGENIAAGQALGETLGRIQEGGLTPGLLGGLYLDFGIFAVLIILACSFFLVLVRKISLSRGLIPFYIVCLTNFLHLFHRGFLKPEYITSVAIVLMYLIFLRIRIR